MIPAVVEFWKKFLESRPDLGHLLEEIPDAWSFESTPEIADSRLQLVLEGKKTATSSMLSVYKSGLKKMPQIGTYQIILDSKNTPRCVIYLTEIWVKKFSDISEKHAYEEGEGDRTLNYWRNAHVRSFSCDSDFNENSEILCERFKLVHRF